MLKKLFFERVDELQKQIRDTQSENIEVAASIIATAIENGGCIHLFDTGHIIDSEIFNRAGGYELMRRFRYNLEITSSTRNRDVENDSVEGLAKIALQKANIVKGDVMIIGSVSGKTVNVIDLADACREKGIKVIVVTSVTYSKQVESLHSSGKRLFELGDVVIDNCAPYGDAMMNIEGVESPFIPASGIAAAYIMWALNAELLEKLLALGIKPGILRSVNYEPNRIYNLELAEQYKKCGF